VHRGTFDPIVGVAIPEPITLALAAYAAYITAWATTAVALDKCLKVKVGYTWSIKGLVPGVTPGHYTGGHCR